MDGAFQMIPPQEVLAVLQRFNPWWEGREDRNPTWRRHAFGELMGWLNNPKYERAVLVSGARQVGKTTLLRQAVAALLDDGINPEQILYATFDHPILKLIGLDGLLQVWEELHPRSDHIEYLLLDEIQYTTGWQTWIKHEVDFNKRRRIAVTGSAIPIGTEEVESGVGRWHTIKLPTLSFFEYLQIKGITPPPKLPAVKSLIEPLGWKQIERARVSAAAKPLVPHFHEYLLRGGFPETAKIDDINMAQKLLWEDIVDKVLKRDMTAHFGTRSILELEKTFLYLCLHDGGILEMTALCGNLGVKKPTVTHFLELFEAANLVYRLSPYGYGKQILRGRHKYYLADASIAGSVLLKGRSLLEDATRLGAAVETAFFKHVFTRYYSQSVAFSYWRQKTMEVDILAELDGGIVPFEVKYEAGRIGPGDVKGLIHLCSEKRIQRGYVITRDISEFELLTQHDADTEILKIPAPLACYWLSQSEGSKA